MNTRSQLQLLDSIIRQEKMHHFASKFYDEEYAESAIIELKPRLAPLGLQRLEEVDQTIIFYLGWRDVRNHERIQSLIFEAMSHFSLTEISDKIHELLREQSAH